VRAFTAGEPAKWSWRPLVKVSPRVALAAFILFLCSVWLGFYQSSRTPALPWSNPQVADEQMMQDLPILEDHDLLSNFEPLNELSSSQEELVSDSQQTIGQGESADYH
jgi:hypothetical protein